MKLSSIDAFILYFILHIYHAYIYISIYLIL